MQLAYRHRLQNDDSNDDNNDSSNDDSRTPLPPSQCCTKTPRDRRMLVDFAIPVVCVMVFQVRGVAHKLVCTRPLRFFIDSLSFRSTKRKFKPAIFRRGSDIQDSVAESECKTEMYCQTFCRPSSWPAEEAVHTSPIAVVSKTTTVVATIVLASIVKLLFSSLTRRRSKMSYSYDAGRSHEVEDVELGGV